MASTSDSVSTSEVNVDGKSAYQLRYSNGYGPCGDEGQYPTRTVDINFYCDSSVQTWDPSKVSCGEEEPCTYFLTIGTNAACSIDFDDGSDGLSIGWIVVIVLLSVFFVYCAIGYAINGSKSKEWGNFRNNIPNYGMWITLFPGI